MKKIFLFVMLLVACVGSLNYANDSNSQISKRTKRLCALGALGCALGSVACIYKFGKTFTHTHVLGYRNKSQRNASWARFHLPSGFDAHYHVPKSQVRATATLLQESHQLVESIKGGTLFESIGYPVGFLAFSLGAITLAAAAFSK